MIKLLKNWKFVAAVIVAALIVPIATYATQTSAASPSTNPSNCSDCQASDQTVVRPTPLSALEQAQQKVDFKIMVPKYLPGNMKLATRGIAYSEHGLDLMYQDLSKFQSGDINSVKSISLHQSKYDQVDIERIRKQCDNEFIEGKRYYSEVEIQGVPAFWTPNGMATCSGDGDKATCQLDKERFRVNWWGDNGVHYVIVTRNVAPDEVLAFAKSLAPLK